ncbi:MAG TPA: histidine phosphatase family protein [Acidimicrobiia bacterium]|jgi:probable phosphoglycerate mutase
MDTPTRLVLIRHGESRSTVDQVVGGHEGCTGLSDLGRRQAEALAARLNYTGELSDATVLLTSILPRAIETAEIIAPTFGGLLAKQDCDLCEIHPGEADGLTWEEFRSRYVPADGSRNLYRPWSPGGESWVTFLARVGATLGDVAKRHPGETVVIVCHGGVIEGSLAAFGNQPLRRPFDVSIENTSITEWSRTEDGAGAGPPPPEVRWRLVRFNDAAHLYWVG